MELHVFIQTFIFMTDGTSIVLPVDLILCLVKCHKMMLAHPLEHCLPDAIPDILLEIWNPIDSLVWMDV